MLRRSVGCKTYMGVLSLQGWRGESDRVNISEHDTKKNRLWYICDTSRHAQDHCHQRVKQVWAHWGVLLSCTIKHSLIKTYARWTLIGQCDWLGIIICAQRRRDVAHHLPLFHRYARRGSWESYSSPLPRRKTNPVLDKGGDKGRKRKRNQVEGSTHLFDMPSPHPSQNPSERGRQGGKRGKTVSAYKSLQLPHLKSPDEWLELNGYAGLKDSNANLNL